VRITSEQILSHTNCGDANSFGANSKLKKYHTKTWLTIIITMNKSERLCIYIYNVRVCMRMWAHAGMCACIDLLPSFLFQSYTNNQYLSCKIALLSFDYILLMQLATILATIHDVRQTLYRMNQYEEGFFRTIS
jgi:hypothetical protein